MILLLKDYLGFCIKNSLDGARLGVEDRSIFWESDEEGGTKATAVNWRREEGFKIYL